MKINLILKANVEWHNKSNCNTGVLQQIAALLAIIASLLTIICH